MLIIHFFWLILIKKNMAKCTKVKVGSIKCRELGAFDKGWEGESTKNGTTGSTLPPSLLPQAPNLEGGRPKYDTDTDAIVSKLRK